MGTHPIFESDFDCLTANMYRPYRAVGVFAGDVAGLVHFHQNRRVHLIEIPIENALHTYKVDGLSLIGISDPMPEPISGCGNYHDLVSAQAGPHIWIYFNGKVEFKHQSEAPITAHFMFTNSLLVMLTETPSLIVYDFREDQILCNIPLEKNVSYTGLLHPPTYENKVLVAAASGAISMFNIKTSKKIFTFNAAGTHRINVMTHTPHLNLIGIGSEDGTFRLVDLKKDEVVLKLNHAKPITALDCQTERPIVACGLSDGSISVWDLEEMSLITQIPAHGATVNSIAYLPREDSFVSIGADNAIKVYVENREHRRRFGHAQPPTRIAFYGSEDKHLIVSAGLDKTLKLFDPEHDSGNKNLGKAVLYHKSEKREHQMSHITHFATSANREQAWDNLVAIHDHSNKASSWSTARLKRGTLNFRMKDEITSVACSTCGNMVWLGDSGGMIEEYNLQSGKRRRQMIGHGGAVVGLGAQLLQLALVSVSEDGTLKAWRIKNGALLETFTLAERPESLAFESRTSLAACALADGSIELVDCSNSPLKRVRRFKPAHSASITHLSWKEDARWLVAASVDRSIRTWDVTSGALIDQFATSAIPTSVAFAPNGQFIATTHVDELGVYLWSNAHAYDPRPLRPIDPDTPVQLLSNLPQMKALLDELTETAEEESESTKDQLEYQSPRYIDGCLTVTGLPNSRWLALINLRTIKSRNKVVDIKPPKQAPFFLPTVAGLKPKFDRAALEETDGSKIMANAAPLMSLITAFGRQMEGYESEHRNVTMDQLINKSPAQLDNEIGTLDVAGCCSNKPLLGLLRLINDCLQAGMYWDAAQAMLKVALQKHFDAITDDSELIELVEGTTELIGSGVGRIERNIEEALLLSQFIINNTIAVQE